MILAPPSLSHSFSLTHFSGRNTLLSPSDCLQSHTLCLLGYCIIQLSNQSPSLPSVFLLHAAIMMVLTNMGHSHIYQIKPQLCSMHTISSVVFPHPPVIACLCIRILQEYTIIIYGFLCLECFPHSQTPCLRHPSCTSGLGLPSQNTTK